MSWSTSRPIQIPPQCTPLSSWIHTHTHSRTRQPRLLLGAGRRLHMTLLETSSQKSPILLQRRPSQTARTARLHPPRKQKTKTCLLPQTRESDRDQLLLRIELLNPQHTCRRDRK